jgi:hypothetical protein
MADYTTIGTGLVFKNLKRANQNQPHYSGTVKINGDDRVVSMWAKKDKNDNTFYSVSIQERTDDDESVESTPEEEPVTDQLELEID